MGRSNTFKRKHALLAACISSAVLASGCSTVNIDRVKESQEEHVEKANRLIETGMKVRDSESSISVSQGYYIAEKPIRLDQRDLLPDFFDNKKFFRQQEPVALQELLTSISDDFNIRIEFTDDAAHYMESFVETEEEDEEVITADDAVEDTESALMDDLFNSVISSGETEGLPGGGIKFSIQHKGSLAELLDRVTGRVGLYWEWDNNQVSIFRTKTEVLKADVNAIRETFSADFASSSGSNDINSSSSLRINYEEDQMSSFEGALEAFLTDEGEVKVMSALNMIVVKDIPSKVKEVIDFVEQVNTDATTQIAVQLDIITVTENETNDYGVDWDGIFNGSSKYGFEFSSHLSNATTSNFKLGFIDPTGNFSGSEALINALRENGLITRHFSDFGHTSNGRSLPLIDEKTEDYIASLSTTVNDDGTVSTDTTISTAVTGFDLNVVPKITSRNKISMDIKFTISELVELEEKNFGGDQVQLPKNTSKSSSYSPVLEPGRTYMIGGIINEEKKTGNASITGGEGTFDWLFGGRKDSSTSRTQTVILVTPYVVRN